MKTMSKTILKNIFVALFGSLNWTLPKWLGGLIGCVCRLIAGIKREHSSHKKRFYCILSCLFLFAAVGASAYFGYIHQPQLMRVSVQGSTIEPTPLKERAKPVEYSITFGGSVAKLSDVGKVVTSGISIVPEIQGVWKWASDSELVFKVTKDWHTGATHRVHLKKTLFPKHIHLETYELELSTPKLKIDIKEASFYQNPKKIRDKRVVVEFHFTHPIDTESFEKNVQLIHLSGVGKGLVARGHKEKMDFTVTYDDFFGKAFLHSKNLTIKNYESRVKVEVKGKIYSKLQGRGVLADIKKSVKVPGILTFFKFQSFDLEFVRNSDYELEQVLILNSTTRVSSKELTKHLEVYSLPKDCPASLNRKKIKGCRWDVDSVSNKVLAVYKKVEVVPIPTKKDFSQTLSYKYKENPGMFLYIHIKKGIKSFGGYMLPRGYSFVAQVPPFPKELKIMAEGSLLSLNGERKLSILSRNIKNIGYRIQRILPGQISNFITQSWGDLSHPKFRSEFNYHLGMENQFGIENISETFSGSRALPLVADGKTQYSHFDFEKFLNNVKGRPRGLFQLTIEEKLKKRSYPTLKGPTDQRFILVTDIGIISKKSVSGGYDLFIQSISSGRPMAGVKVQVMGKNGLPALTKRSNHRGHVWFSSLKNFKQEKEPVAFVVTKGVDLSFLPIRTHTKALNYSRFDVGGVHVGNQSHSLKSYMFSDRGIYRPGERVRIGYVIKNSDNWSESLSGVRLSLSVENPKGQSIKNEEDIGLNQEGLQTYEFETNDNWITGDYTVSLFAKMKEQDRIQMDSINVKVEEFVPDRLKISANFSKPLNKGWLHPKDLKAHVHLKNLFGTPAQNRRIVGKISLIPRYPSFNAYKDWKFYSSVRSQESFNEELGEQTTNKEGSAVFNLGLDKFDSSSYLLNFMVEGFEAEGGRSVQAFHTTLVSPLEYLVGHKAQGALKYIHRGAQLGVDFIAVDAHLEKVPVQELTLKIVHFQYVSTLVKKLNGTYKYESIKKEREVKSLPFHISASGTSVPLDTSQAGDFALVVLNGDHLELSRVPYSVAGKSNLASRLERNAELKVQLNKNDFAPGDEIEINIRSPYVGSGLIAIERERIFAYKWFHASTKNTVQRIRIPMDFEGNGYVNVMFVRSLSSNEIFMSPLSVGVAPFSIHKSSRINKISLHVPSLVRPGDDLEIDIASTRKGKAIVFAVDEGILQFAEYKNPDPLSHFYEKQALEVETRQILHLILPEFSKVALRRSSESGGASGSLLGKNLNPFKRQRDKSVAYWSGLMDIGPKSQKLTYSVPDYFSGQLRVIAVAVSPDTMGVSVEKTLVKGPFVISPNTPTFVAPKDDLTVSVGISNNVQGSGENAEVEVHLKTSENIKIKGSPSVSLKINEGDEASATFDIVAQEPLGHGELVFTARYKDQSSQRRSTLSVRPATPLIISVHSGYLDANKSIKVATPRRAYKEFQSNEVSVSKVPLGLTKSFVNYLQKYPYDCTEQIISQGFPSLVFGNYEEWGKTKSEIATQVQDITEILSNRQRPDGSFTKWPGPYEEDAFHTAYAVHYLTEARDRGYEIPKPLMKHALSYLEDFSKQETKDLSMARIQSYGAYLLARNEFVVTQSLTSLEQWLEKHYAEYWFKDIVTLYMASAYKIMKASIRAQKLLMQFDDTHKTPSEYKYGVYDDTIKRAMHLYLVSKHFPHMLSAFDGEKINILVKQLSRAYNTNSSSLSILAFESYAQGLTQIKKKGSSEGLPDTSGISVVEWVEKAKNALKLEGSLFPKSDFSSHANEISISNDSQHVAYFSVIQEGFDRKSSQVPLVSGIEVFKEFIDKEGNIKDIAKDKEDKVKLGDELTVRLRTRSIDSFWVSNIAIVDLLPGGFEVVLDSIDRDSGKVEYVDAREDRVLIFTHFTKEIKSYTYKIKAINKGRYQVPPVFAESMYDRQLQSKGIAKEIVVE